MRRRIIQIFVSLLLLGAMVLNVSCEKWHVLEQQPRHSVVVIHSWDSAGEEGELFTKVMEKAFEKRGMNVEVHHIYANMIRRDGEVFTREDWPRYVEAIKEWNPEVILLNDDPIVRWVLTHEEADSIFSTTPTVFAGVSALLRDSLPRFPLMTGFEAHINLSKNIEVMMYIAKSQCVTIELDYGVEDDILRSQLEEELRDSVRFVNNSDFHVMDFSEENLQKNYPGLTVVNFVSCAAPYMNHGEGGTDEDGQEITNFFYQKARDMWQLQVKYDIFSSTLIDYSGRPQITCIRERFNNPKKLRYLAGYFTSTPTQVEDQVEYAVRIMKGEEPKRLNITYHASDYYMDWAAMRQAFPEAPYGMYSSKFHIINEPFYLDKPGWFAMLLILGILLMLALIALILRVMLRWKYGKQKKLVAELQYEEKVHDLLFSTTKDTPWMLNDRGFSFSKEFATYLGLASNELTMEEMEKVIHEESKPSFEFLKDFRQQRGRKTVRLRIAFNGKDWHWNELMYTATDETARAGELYGLLLNVDKRKETEEQLKQAQMIASQVALKENFLANVGHDLRTPLNAIAGLSTLLTTPDMTFEPGEREQYGQIIRENTDMILRMIDSVMEKAQLDTGTLEIIQKPTSVTALVQESYNTNSIIAPTHLQFLLEMVEPDAMVNIDMTRTKQVVNNFLNNAFKFTAEGSVTLGWKYVNGRNKEFVEVYVRDTGIGVEDDKQAQLFERYKKVNETDGGTGLGLNISKTIVERQGGSIGVRSQFGKGSTFFFRLPRFVQCCLLMLTLGLGLLVPSSCTSEYIRPEKRANILLLHSFEKRYTAYRKFDDHILQTFRDYNVNPDIQHVYLDLGNPYGDSREDFERLQDSLKKKGWVPDVVLVEGDRAAHEMLVGMEQGYVRGLEDVPCVLGGLHHPEWKYLRKYSNMVVINDPIDYCTNINLAVEMTGKNCVEIELDYFNQDSLIRNELRQALARPPYVDNSDFHLEGITDENLSTVWKDSVVVLVYSTASPERNAVKGYEREAGYRNLKNIYINSWLYPSLVVKRDLYSSAIVDKTARPQFTAVKAGFANGSGKYLCGYFASYATVGEDMVRVASEILAGESVASFVGLTHEKEYYMDYQAMQELGMDYKDYENRFVIVGASFKKQSPVLAYSIWFIIAAMFLIAICSVVLVVKSLKDRTEHDLIENVKRGAELRKLALHGVDSHTVHTEANLKDIISHIHPNYLGEVPNIIQSVDVEGTYSYEIYADIDVAGDYRWWELRFVVMLNAGTGAKQVDGILINIDKSKQYEEDLRVAMELAEEARQKEDFLMTISHEIRTPLNAVVGFSDVIVSMPADAFTAEELAEYAKIIKKNNMNLSAMIEDILMLARIESGRIQYVKEEFDAASLIHDVANDWQDLMPDGVCLRTLEVQQGVVVDNDRARVKYILNQLVSNAVKFTKQGTIAIGVAYHLNADRAEFFVGDTGCGIPKKKQPLTFELFWKDDGFVPGLGLGLHVAKKLAEGMGLTLEVESKVGFGSQFSLFADGMLKRPSEGVDGC